MIVQPDFLTHWKTRKLCTRLKEKHAPLYVLRLWSLCQTSKRDVIPADHETIAAICEYDGESKRLLDALLDCGFIEPENNGEHIVHGWSEVNQRLIHNWTVGVSGGRPKVKQEKPKDNPRVSQTKPIDGLDRLDREIEGGNNSHHEPVSFYLTDIIEWAASPTVGMPKAMATEFFDHYNSVGWLKGQSKHQMTKRGEIESAMRQWKIREPSMGKKDSQEPRRFIK